MIYPRRLVITIICSLLGHVSVLFLGSFWMWPLPKPVLPPPPALLVAQLTPSMVTTTKSPLSSLVAQEKLVNKKLAAKKALPRQLLSSSLAPLDTVETRQTAEVMHEEGFTDLLNPSFQEGSSSQNGELAKKEEKLAKADLENRAAASVNSGASASQVDLIFNGYRGKSGFWVGQGTFRLKQDATGYELSTLGEAKGILALVYWGQFRQWSRGVITETGAKPVEYKVELGSSDRTEKATVDWESHQVTLRNGEKLAFTGPLQDQLSFLLQFYFAPPSSKRYVFTMLSPRKLEPFVFEQLGEETVAMEWGAVATQHWQRVSEDGARIDLWLAPEYRLMPVKVRYANKNATKVNELRLAGILIDQYNPLTGTKQTQDQWLHDVQRTPLGASGHPESTNNPPDQP